MTSLDIAELCASDRTLADAKRTSADRALLEEFARTSNAGALAALQLRVRRHLQGRG